MKKSVTKILSVVLSVIFLLSFTSCKDKKVNEKVPEKETTKVTAKADAKTKNEKETTTKEKEEEKTAEETTKAAQVKEENTKAAEGAAATVTENNTTTTQTSATPVRDYDMAQDFLNQLNAYRASKGLCQLQMVPFMQEFSMTRAGELISNYSHSGATIERAISACPTIDLGGGRTGYTYSYACENIVRGTAPSNEIVNDALTAFKNSSAHEANQTNPKWTHVGVGVVKIVYGESWVDYYIAVNFYYENDFS